MQDSHAHLQASIGMKENTDESVTHENLVEACARTAGHKKEPKNTKSLERYLETAINLYPEFALANVCRNAMDEEYVQSAIANATDIITHAGPNGLNGLVLMSVRPLSKLVQGQKIAWLKVVCTSNESNNLLKGLPRYLIFRALRRAKDCGATMAALHSTYWPDITRFYHELGFRCVRRNYESSLSHDALWRLLYTSYGYEPEDQKVYVIDLRKKLLSEDELAENNNGRRRQLVEMPDLDENTKGLFDVMCNTPKMYANPSSNVYFGGRINAKLTQALKKNEDKLKKYKDAFKEFAAELQKIKETGERNNWNHTDDIEVEVKADNATEVNAPERPRTRASMRAELMRAQDETIRSFRETTKTKERIATEPDTKKGRITIPHTLRHVVGDVFGHSRTTIESQQSTATRATKAPPKKPAKTTPPTGTLPSFERHVVGDMFGNIRTMIESQRSTVEKKPPTKPAKNTPPTEPAVAFHLSRNPKPETEPDRKSNKHRNESSENTSHEVVENAHLESSSSSKGPTHKEVPTHEEFKQLLRNGFDSVDKIDPVKGKDQQIFAFLVKMDGFEEKSAHAFSAYLNNKLGIPNEQISNKFQPYISQTGGNKKKRQYLAFFTNKSERITSQNLGSHRFIPGTALVWDSATVPGGVSWTNRAPENNEPDRFRVVMA